jgi:hypothetical protein
MGHNKRQWVVEHERRMIAVAALAVDLSDHVRENAFGDYLLDYVHDNGVVEAQWLHANDIPGLLWAIAESEVCDE